MVNQRTEPAAADKQSIQLYKETELKLKADKIYSCQFGFVCESENEDELLSVIGGNATEYMAGKISGCQYVSLDNGGAEKITKKNSVIHYEFFGKSLRGDKAMLLIKCFSKDGKKG